MLCNGLAWQSPKRLKWGSTAAGMAFGSRSLLMLSPHLVLPVPLSAGLQVLLSVWQEPHIDLSL